MTLDELVGFQRAEFHVANVRRYWMLGLQAITAVVAGVSVFVEDHTTLFIMAIASVVLAVAWGGVSWSYERHRDAGNRGRRATLVVGGMGEPASASEMQQLREGFLVRDRTAKGYEDADYFASSAKPGLQRMSEMISESAFWSRRLHHASAWAMFVAFVALAVVLCLIVLASIPMGDLTSRLVATRLVLALVLLLLSTDVLGNVYGHWAAATSIKDIDLRLRAAEQAGAKTSDTLLLLMDYNSAVERAPVVFPPVYKLLKARLNGEWASYRGNANKPGAV
ncbi:MAG: hypothetical protein Q8L54_03940 [Devosia sp.]|nr:hypothetical protein [Devosia sp.]